MRMPMRKGQNPVQERQPTVRLVMVVAVLSLLFGLSGIGEIAEDYLRTSRNRMTATDASGQIVLIAIDDKAQREVGTWPWPRSTQAKLVERIDSAAPAKILMDIVYDFPTVPKEDRALAAAFARSGKVTVPIRTREGTRAGSSVAMPLLERFNGKVRQGVIAVHYNYQNAVWRMGLGDRLGSRAYPSFAAILAGQSAAPGQSFPVDYRVRLSSIPRFAASDVLASRVPADALRGKSVIVGTASANTGDQFFIPGFGREGGVYKHIFGAETLLAGRPIDLGWAPALAAALVLVAFALLRADKYRIRMMVAAGALIALTPLIAEPLHIFLDITPGLFALGLAGSVLAWRRYRRRGFVNSTTGLPNLDALKALRNHVDQPLIVARIMNYPQLSAALPASDEIRLVEQIVGRLGVGKTGSAVYQGDEGIFAWLAEPNTAIGHHVEALHALFRSPARIGDSNFDLAVAFGVEIGSGRGIARRLASALVAADEAASEGLKWKYHDPDRFRDENWRLSLLAQLDEAIDRGEIWVAFQPQMDLASGRLRGAEALARWTHPEKGPISPHEFVTAAESHGRIDRLTLYVLSQSIAAAARINRRGEPFDIAVNLSARTLSRRSFPAEVRAMLEEHGLAPERLTLELTETAALAGDGSDLDPLVRLRDLGVKLSIDDYGTGLSTLDYLKKVPASEIKIDQSFIKSLRDNRSDLLMVQSTISLAHSLGRTVVAEGVEDRETLDLLTQMRCDVAQGFMIGRPKSLEGLLRVISSQKRGRAA